MAPPAFKNYERVQPKSRAGWRRWLEKNHDKSPGIWLVLVKKNSAQPRMEVAAAVEEALCFGWIDSLPNKLDDERYLLLLTPRKPGSAWSRVNKGRVKKLIQAGLMAPPGLAKIEAAKRDGSWTKLDKIEALEVPEDLKNALAKNKTAKLNFEKFPPSARKGLLQWIDSAKKAETRANRIAKTVADTAEAQVANAYRKRA